MENKSGESVLSRMRLRRMDSRGYGWMAHPVFLALIADVILAAAFIGLSPSGWMGLFGGVIGIKLSVLTALIGLPIAIVASHVYVRVLGVLLLVLGVAVFFLAHGIV